MKKIINSELIERLFFTAIVAGILMVGFGAFNFWTLSNRIAENEATMIRAKGGEVAVGSTNEGYSLMQADLERRDLVRDRFNMMVVGGVGLALLGFGWMATDIVKSRRKKQDESPMQAVAEATS